ncbi:helix-turn-helix domain-containing protein [Megasphaera micronuciformis]|uniref:HTH cro/C1-type domain-containing protein n=1 Tax=Megasphaera micronuciformis F0359 TaxID=706434 RepID=E2ZAX2_9FIRM|nr:hypothetical protein HMPREF9429_00593 [Megasphaera micronuciformis F0359]
MKNRINKSGIKIYALAEACGLTPQGLYNKLNGKNDFRCSEIICLSKALNLSPEDRNAIFLPRLLINNQQNNNRKQGGKK